MELVKSAKEVKIFTNAKSVREDCSLVDRLVLISLWSWDRISRFDLIEVVHKEIALKAVAEKEDGKLFLVSLLWNTFGEDSHLDRAKWEK